MSISSSSCFTNCSQSPTASILRALSCKCLASPKALPDAQWRLMFALARYGGLRCPSEVLSLRWGDSDWAGQRIVVVSPKTEHHEGGASRVIPLFPELLPYLEDCRELAADGCEFVIWRYRKTNSNYGVLLNKLVRRAGLPTWPKPFQNLRACGRRNSSNCSRFMSLQMDRQLAAGRRQALPAGH